jgi:hypothetical protein
MRNPNPNILFLGLSKTTGHRVAVWNHNIPLQGGGSRPETRLYVNSQLMKKAEGHNIEELVEMAEGFC